MNASPNTADNGLYVTIGLLAIMVFLMYAVALWKIFEKAGRPKWAAVIPVYNAWTLFEISGKPGWWGLSVLLFIIPTIGWIPFFVLYIFAALELAKRFGKDQIFAVLWLIIIAIAGLLILGFGKDKYKSGKSKSQYPHFSHSDHPTQLPPVQPPKA